jgi:hypothetical protein
MPIYGPVGIIVCDLLLFEGVKNVILWSDLMILNCSLTVQDPPFFSLQKIAHGTKHTLIQAMWLDN